MLAILPLARKSRKRQEYLDVGGIQGRSVVVLRTNSANFWGTQLIPNACVLFSCCHVDTGKTIILLD